MSSLMTLNPDQMALIKREIAPNCTNDELALFKSYCERTGLDPFARQIYCIKRRNWNKDKNAWEEKMSIQTSIDGFRVIAERSEDYEGQDGPYWCGPEGIWVDVWLGNDLPMASKVGVFKKGCRQAIYGIALWREYAQTTKDGNLMGLWKKMPTLMLAKVAESLALRKAFPNDLSGLYTQEEMPEEKDVTPKETTAQLTTTETPQLPPPEKTHAPESLWSMERIKSTYLKFDPELVMPGTTLAFKDWFKNYHKRKGFTSEVNKRVFVIRSEIESGKKNVNGVSVAMNPQELDYHHALDDVYSVALLMSDGTIQQSVVLG